jgi:DNA-binding NtrC family response regulator
MHRISDQAWNLLLAQPWPGNVRELENTIERGVLIGSGEELLPEHLILEDSFSECSPSAFSGGNDRSGNGKRADFQYVECS